VLAEITPVTVTPLGPDPENVRPVNPAPSTVPVEIVTPAPYPFIRTDAAPVNA
jgi:hypothetical protein